MLRIGTRYRTRGLVVMAEETMVGYPPPPECGAPPPRRWGVTAGGGEARRVAGVPKSPVMMSTFAEEVGRPLSPCGGE